MSRSRSNATEAIVLKRTNVGESDRIITLFTRDQGKIAVVAKGVRSLSSSRRAYLEPGNHVKCLLISTHSMSLLTQATLIDDAQAVRQDLARIRQLVQLLEIVDALFVEEVGEGEFFDDVLRLREMIVGKRRPATEIRKGLEELITNLGYQHPSETKYKTILEYVSALADKPMRSFEYLKVE
jgi:recombinational DNA repair protein (RecF pathway)